MATNKHALIRYHALDQCFSNIGRKYSIDNLLEACNEALYEFSGTKDGVKRRQIYEDIKFLESEQGWSISLDKIKEGRHVYYRYTDKSFSIKNQIVNETEVEQIKETLGLLTRFKGMPQFDWIDEMLVRLESVFQSKERNNVVVGFEQNQFLKGLNYFTELFNAIQYKKVLSIQYKGFKQVKPSNVKFHPYYLKQYNNRWFLFGFNEDFSSISNLALDRIISIIQIQKNYKENLTINFEDFFDDVVGVTVSDRNKVEKVLIEIGSELWPYIESKPIHGSQKLISKVNGKVTIELKVQINYELVTTLFALGEGLKVLQPDNLKNELITKANSLLNKYL